MDFDLLDEIVAAGWLFGITGIPELAISNKAMFVILLVPGSPRGAESATVPDHRSALDWLANTIIENHGHSKLARRLKKSGSA